MKPLLLHSHASSPNPVKIAIALNYLEIPYNVKIWEMGDDPQVGVRGERFRKITPNGRVPVLVDPNTDVVVWESGAIMNYIKRQYDATNILGPRSTHPQAQAELEQWEFLLLTTIAPMTGQLFWFRFVESTPNPAADARYEKQVYMYYDVVEKQLEKTGGGSILPGGISSADIHYYPWLQRPDYVKVSLEAYPNIRGWLKVMSEQEHVRNGYKKILEAVNRPDPFNIKRGIRNSVPNPPGTELSTPN